MIFVLMLPTLRIGKNRNVLEDLAEQVVGYCQHLPADERTVYLLAAGHSEASGMVQHEHVEWFAAFMPAAGFTHSRTVARLGCAGLLLLI